MDPVLAAVLFIVVVIPVANVVLSSLAENAIDAISHRLFIRKEMKRRAKFTKSASTLG